VTAKEYLMQIRGLEMELQAKNRLLQNLKQKSVSLTSPSFGDKVQTSHGHSNLIERIIDLENEIESRNIRLLDKIDEINKKIECVHEPLLIGVLTDRYINHQSWEQIAENMNKSDRTVRVWHGQALQIFRKETGMK